MELPWREWFFYRLLKWTVVNPLFRFVYRGAILRSTPIPRTGPLIIVCNHASYLDPPFLSNAMCRPVAFMAKAELFRVPLLKQAIRVYGAYPVKRGGSDRSALKASQDALERGWAIGIFLNGTRTHDGRIPNPHLGAALISAHSQVPLLPVALWGTHQVLPKGRSLPKLFCPIRVQVGSLIPPPASSDRSTLLQTTQACVDSIHQMLDHLEQARN
jgi:1-acyl-sn-glycerol-3-phosphate acyltransferase